MAGGDEAFLHHASHEVAGPAGAEVAAADGDREQEQVEGRQAVFRCGGAHCPQVLPHAEEFLGLVVTVEV